MVLAFELNQAYVNRRWVREPTLSWNQFHSHSRTDGQSDIYGTLGPTAGHPTGPSPRREISCKWLGFKELAERAVWS